METDMDDDSRKTIEHKQAIGSARNIYDRESFLSQLPENRNEFGDLFPICKIEEILRRGGGFECGISGYVFISFQYHGQYA